MASSIGFLHLAQRLGVLDSTRSIHVFGVEQNECPQWRLFGFCSGSRQIQQSDQLILLILFEILSQNKNSKIVKLTRNDQYVISTEPNQE